MSCLTFVDFFGNWLRPLQPGAQCDCLHVGAQRALLASLPLGELAPSRLEGELFMKTRDFLTLALAAFILAVIFSISPKVETTANEASVSGAHGIDILGLTRNARNLPEEDYPAH